MLLSISLVSLLFSLFWVVWFVYKDGVQEIFTNHIVLTNVFFIVIHILLPFLQWHEAYFRYMNYDYGIYVESVVLVFVLNFVYTLSLIFFKGHSISFEHNFYLSDKNKSRILKLSFLFFLIGSFCAYINIKAIFSIGLDLYIRDRISLGVGNGLTLLLSHWVYVTSLIFYFVFIISKGNKIFRRISFFLFFVSFLFSVFYYSINSNRNSIFILVINLIAIYFYLTGENKSRVTYSQMKKVFFLVVLSIFFIGVFFQLGKLRHSGYGESYAGTGYSLVKALNGAFGNHENITWLVGNNFELSYGGTYLAALTNFVPRSIWPEKPLGAGPILKNTIYPGSYVIGQKGNSSLTTGLYTEVIMNFGFFASCLALIVIAFIISILFRFFKRHSNGVGGLIFIFSVVVFSSQFLYAEFLGFLVRYVFSVIPLIFCYFIQVGEHKNETSTTRYG
ncbi:hypothetical protein BA894_01660 [Vibrio natriegens]|uniref:oligosaccharide repeat unit polymerase n=1 Tax=Vibrio natriegens TaxID=691 RepID=UPI000803FCDC|nr:oligosaccharide repeat unit polymerase [Vibrio natriegens]ANQ25236.1 hypothetical protein BA894_01660 [Vibrio natriegens]